MGKGRNKILTQKIQVDPKKLGLAFFSLFNLFNPIKALVFCPSTLIFDTITVKFFDFLKIVI